MTGLKSSDATKAIWVGMMGRVNKPLYFAARVKIVQVLKPKTDVKLRCKVLADFEALTTRLVAGQTIELIPEDFTPNSQWRPLAEELSSEVHLPTYAQCDSARAVGNASPLETFIYDHCPGTDSQERKFFADLKKTIEFCIETRLRG